MTLSKKSQIRIEGLSRLMVYMLGHRPDEFGLVPDKEGFIKLKELLWAIHEEEGWRYVGPGHIREVLLSGDRTLFEADEKRIKARDRRWELDLKHPIHDLPKLLFHPIRPRAHLPVMERGLDTSPGEHLTLTAAREMALRIGLRRDQKPVILEISVDRARRTGTNFFTFGNLFLTEKIPSNAILGPPVSRESEKSPRKELKEEPLPVPDFQPGSFILDASRDPAPWRKDKGQRPRGWKEEARKMRRKDRS